LSPAVRPIRLPGAQALEALEAHAVAALEPWAAGWLRPRARPLAVQLRPVRVDDAQEQTVYGPFERWQGVGGRLWIRVRGEDRAALLRASLGEPFLDTAGRPIDAWAATLGERGWQARNAALSEAWIGAARPTPCASPDPDVYAFGAGAVCLESPAIGLFAIADAGVWRHLPGGAVRRRDAGSPCVPLDRACGRAAVRLSVSAGRVELGLRTLLGLRAGDVLRLPTRLDETLTLGHGAAPPLRCALGEAAGRAAVRLRPCERGTT
jgi:hypothetical protein